MSTKLTLSLDKEIIEKAKEYAREHKVSLSYLVENYLLRILSEMPSATGGTGSMARKLTGIVQLDERDYREDFVLHQRNKHQ